MATKQLGLVGCLSWDKSLGLVTIMAGLHAGAGSGASLGRKQTKWALVWALPWAWVDVASFLCMVEA